MNQRHRALVSLMVILYGCMESGSVKPPVSGFGGSVAVTGEYAFDGHVVMYTLSEVMRSENGKEVRRVEFTEAGHPG